ncbi:MAG: formyltetrahydrofolate deformylase [Omnitrophica bacterium RIFCSPHIGHO2_02_FULL_51_18]|nr:MAG: formyltetrahydrofolate deformylase [Omnitrophica bacterium RIFCSPHIGHO2_02_FULL_51_18]
MSENHVLRVECADAKGLIHKITGVLYRQGLNIIENGEFVDSEIGRFFMRTEVAGKADAKKITAELQKHLPPEAIVGMVRDRKKDIVLFATTEPHCLGDLLIRHAYGELPANVLAVVSNHDSLKSLAGRFKVPYFYAPADGKAREAHEAALLKILSRLKPEYIVLAKYMRILSDKFVGRFKGRILNIHHSFLPAFAGASPYQQAAERGVKIIGATAHFVTPALDDGPIIAQGVVPVDHSHSASDIAQAGHDVEKIVLTKALKLALEGRIFVSGNKTIIFD